MLLHSIYIGDDADAETHAIYPILSVNDTFNTHSLCSIACEIVCHHHWRYKER